MEEGSACQRCPSGHCHSNLDLLPTVFGGQACSPASDCQVPHPFNIVLCMNHSSQAVTLRAPRSLPSRPIFHSGRECFPAVPKFAFPHKGVRPFSYRVDKHLPPRSCAISCISRRLSFWLCAQAGHHLPARIEDASRLPFVASEHISTARVATNSRIRGTGIGLLSWLRSAEVRSRSVWQHERRMDTSGPF